MAYKSDKSPDWVARAIAANPVAKLDNGNFTSGPVRLSWPNIFSRGKAMNEGEEGKFGAAILFPVGVNLLVLQQAALECAKEKFSGNFSANGQPFGLHFPFRDQGEKERFDGYVPGQIFMTCVSGQQPPCVDQSLRPLTDESKVYPGVWAIVSLNAFSWDRKVKKGVSFGLQSVMIVSDDVRWGATADPNADFAKVNPVETDTSYSGAAAFGQTPGTVGASPEDTEAAARRALGL